MNRARTLSAIFVKYPEVKTSDVLLHADSGGYYVVNSEGTEVQDPENVSFLRARATAQSSDGMTVHDSVTFHALDAGHLPSEAEMTRGLTRMAERRGGDRPTRAPKARITTVRYCLTMRPARRFSPRSWPRI